MKRTVRLMLWVFALSAAMGPPARAAPGDDLIMHALPTTAMQAGKTPAFHLLISQADPHREPSTDAGPSATENTTTRTDHPDQAPPASSVQQPASGSLLPRDLSPWGMFLSAHIVVKLVMIILVAASIFTWTIALAKGLDLLFAKRRLRYALRTLGQARSLTDATNPLKRRGLLGPALAAAVLELRLSADIAHQDGTKERVASRLERIEAEAGRRMARGTGILATIGAIAPFVGLFGTVWGIMNSFIGISKQHTTNLAVVAPGIAEALLATALGLFAAIPAVVIYNLFSRAIASYRARYADATAEILRLVSRDLDRQEGHSPLPKARSEVTLSVDAMSELP